MSERKNIITRVEFIRNICCLQTQIDVLSPTGGSYTEGAIPFGDTDGSLTEDPTNFSYDPLTQKLTVTGAIDPTWLQFSGPQADAGVANSSIYITDGSASGASSGNIVFKDAGGAYHDLEAGGGGGINSVSEDLTPALGGNLDVSSFGISWPSGITVVDVLDEDTLGSNSDVSVATQQSIKAYVDDAIASLGFGDVNGPGLSSDNSVVRWDGVSGDLVQNSGVRIDDLDNMLVPGTLDIGSSIPVDSVLDEDTMVSNSATALATQQSIKAYVDAQAGGSTTFEALTDTPVGFTTANAIYTTNATANAVSESTVVLTEGVNTFNITKGTASLDIAPAAAVNIDQSLIIDLLVEGILDEDTMVSNSATHLATQQSIKAYVDSQAGGNGIYGGSGSVPAGTTTATVSTGRTFEIDAAAAASTFIHIGAVTTGSRFVYNGSVNGVSLRNNNGSRIQALPNQLLISIDNDADTAVVTDNRTSPAGLEYSADYSVNYTTRSLVDKAYVDGQIPTTADGTYTPTLTLVAGTFTSAATIQSQYIRVGNTVHVSGAFQGDGQNPSGGPVQLRLTLPIASNFATARDAVGMVMPEDAADWTEAHGGDIRADTVNDELDVFFTAEASAAVYHFQATYQVI